MIYFEDRSFPSQQQSLGLEELGVKASEAAEVKWIRISALLQTQKLFFSKPVAKNGIHSSGSFALALNQIPFEALNDLFAISKPNQKGCYVVALYKQSGFKQFIVIDDHMPCSQSGSLLFIQSADSTVIGPSLIQKAFAKRCGNY